MVFLRCPGLQGANHADTQFSKMVFWGAQGYMELTLEIPKSQNGILRCPGLQGANHGDTQFSKMVFWGAQGYMELTMEIHKSQEGILRGPGLQGAIYGDTWISKRCLEVPKSQKFYFEESNYTELTMEDPKSILGKATMHGANHGET